MTRTLFFLTALAAMLMTVTGVLIRIELAYPGVSPLFMAPDGFPDTPRFDAVFTAHALFSYLCVIMLGTTMCSAARDKAAPLGGFLVGLGCALGVGVTVLMALAYLPPLPTAGSTDALGTGVGWVLYPPLSTNAGTSLLDSLIALLAGDAAPDPMLIASYLPQVPILPAMGMLYVGAYAMLSTQPGLRWVGMAGFALTLIVTLLVIPVLMDTGLPFGSIAYISLTLPFVACAAVRLSDDGPAWLMMLTFGAIITLIVQVVIITLPQSPATSGMVVTAAMAYIFPLGLGWFALPAVIMFAVPQRYSDAATLSAALFIAVALCLWLGQMVLLGLAGQPARYLDYPDAYAVRNLAASVAVGLFIVGYLGVITVLRRMTRRARP